MAQTGQATPISPSDAAADPSLSTSGDVDAAFAGLAQFESDVYTVARGTSQQVKITYYVATPFIRGDPFSIDLSHLPAGATLDTSSVTSPPADSQTVTVAADSATSIAGSYDANGTGVFFVLFTIDVAASAQFGLQGTMSSAGDAGSGSAAFNIAAPTAAFNNTPYSGKRNDPVPVSLTISVPSTGSYGVDVVVPSGWVAGDVDTSDEGCALITSGSGLSGTFDTSASGSCTVTFNVTVLPTLTASFAAPQYDMYAGGAITVNLDVSFDGPIDNQSVGLVLPSGLSIIKSTSFP